MKKIFYFNKKWRFFLSFLFLCTSVFLLFQNCGEFKSNSSSRRGFSSHSCKVQPSTSDPFEDNRIQIDLRNKVSIQSTSPSGGEPSQAQEREFALLVDNFCLSQSEQPIEILGQVVQVPTELESLDTAAITMTFSGEIDMDQLTEDVENSPCLVGITENEEFTLVPLPESPSVQGLTVLADSTSIFNDPRAGDQDHLNFLNLSQSYTDIRQQITANVVVAVLDTGIDEDHPDLANQLWSNSQGRHGQNFSTSGDSNNIDDKNGHGTHVAGIIASEQNNGVGIAGLSGNSARIMGVKVLNDKGSGGATGIYNGIEYAVANGADVINLSIGTDYRGVMSSGLILYLKAIKRATDAGVVVVMSAGNANKEITENYCPSLGCFGYFYEGALTVASVDSSSGNLSTFSNYGSVDIAAPGSEHSSSPGKGILSTIITGDYGRKSGTSMAAPVVAGAAAFLIGYLKTKGISYTPSSVETFLKEKGSRQSSALSSIPKGLVIDFNLMSDEIKKLPLISCGSEFTPNNDQTGCIPKNISCPTGFALSNDQTGCVPSNISCPTGFALSNDQTACVPSNISCSPGFKLNSDQTACIPSNISCPPGFRLNSDQTACIPTSSVPDGGVCL